MIHHAYSLHRFEMVTKRPITHHHRIIEFGGGYGSLCRLVHKLGFHGDYVIFDLPEISALQRYYLKSVNIGVSDETSAAGVRCFSDYNLLAETLSESSDWLFIALWSISEVPMSVRRMILAGITSSVDTYFLAFQNRFGDLDNSVFFKEWVQSAAEVKWSEEVITHLPGNQYLFGTRSA